MVLSTARKPEGGFQFISVLHLCALWCAYQSQRIRLSDVRLWCAAQEMVARRCQLTGSKQPVYRQEEWRALTRKKGGITTALARLQNAGLLTWEGTTLTFPSPHSELLPLLVSMMTHIPNHHRRIPVPRRLLRFLAQGGSRVLVATIFGHLFRCLYYRQGQCRADGFCKASWIAQVFGVSERAVKTARQRLETLGFLQRQETPQWVRNRYGQKMTINLQWIGGAPNLVPATAEREPAPLPRSGAPEVAPPDSHRKLLAETIHQEPTTGGPGGSLSTLFLRAQASLRNGTIPRHESAPALIQVLPHSSASSPVRTPRIPPLSPPQLQHILLADLQCIDRVCLLYGQASQAGLIGQSEADHLAFVALAQHVLAFRPANPGGLFLQLLRQRRFSVITQAEEDIARHRLKTYLYPPAAPNVSLAAAAAG